MKHIGGEPIHIISLGAGVQSSTMALMAAAGQITPMPVAAIFADTQAEPKSVYTWLDWLEKQLPFPVHRVTKGSLMSDTLIVREKKDRKGSWCPSDVPHYSVNADGSPGQGPRQCTRRYKLAPILAKQTELVGKENLRVWRTSHRLALSELSKWEIEMREWNRNKKAGKPVGHAPIRPFGAWQECQQDPLAVAWIGISLDEIGRIKDPLKPWINHRYSLIEMRKSRWDCLEWMKLRGFQKPPRSACLFCPFHNDSEWRRLRDEEPAEFRAAIEFERKYQAAKALTVSRKAFVPYLHPSRKPLSEVDFSTEEERGQLNLFNNECEGMCGV